MNEDDMNGVGCVAFVQQRITNWAASQALSTKCLMRWQESPTHPNSLFSDFDGTIVAGAKLN
jgi:hypothetical protein